MDIESLREFCLSLPDAAEDVKWGNDLCFSIGGKMFCVCPLIPPLTITIKVSDAEFNELCSTENINPAAYVGRYKWISVSNVRRFSNAEWKHYIKQSYDLIAAKLPKNKK